MFFQLGYVISHNSIFWCIFLIEPSCTKHFASSSLFFYFLLIFFFWKRNNLCFWMAGWKPIWLNPCLPILWSSTCINISWTVDYHFPKVSLILLAGINVNCWIFIIILKLNLDLPVSFNLYMCEWIAKSLSERKQVFWDK